MQKRKILFYKNEKSLSWIYHQKWRKHRPTKWTAYNAYIAYNIYIANTAYTTSEREGYYAYKGNIAFWALEQIGDWVDWTGLKPLDDY